MLRLRLPMLMIIGGREDAAVAHGEMRLPQHAAEPKALEDVPDAAATVRMAVRKT